MYCFRTVFCPFDKLADNFLHLNNLYQTNNYNEKETFTCDCVFWFVLLYLAALGRHACGSDDADAGLGTDDGGETHVA